MKMRVSLTDKRGDIGGTVQIDGDGVFRMESLLTIVRVVDKANGVPVSETLDDLKAMDKL